MRVQQWIRPTVWVVFSLAMASGCATLHTTAAPAPQAVDASKGVASADGATTWLNALDVGVEGRGWSDGLKHPYDRFQAEAEGKIPDPV